MEYTYYKFLHLFIVVLFLGNITIGHFWMHIAHKSRDIGFINHTVKGKRKTDRFLTLPGALLMILFGLLAAAYGRIPLMGSGWIAWSITTFLVSGLAYSFGVIPLQKKIHKLSQDPANQASFDWERYGKLYKAWETWEFIALVTSWAAFVMMVLKIPN